MKHDWIPIGSKNEKLQVPVFARSGEFMVFNVVDDCVQNIR